MLILAQDEKRSVGLSRRVLLRGLPWGRAVLSEFCVQGRDSLLVSLFPSFHSHPSIAELLLGVGITLNPNFRGNPPPPPPPPAPQSCSRAGFRLLPCAFGTCFGVQGCRGLGFSFWGLGFRVCLGFRCFGFRVLGFWDLGAEGLGV